MHYLNPNCEMMPKQFFSASVTPENSHVNVACCRKDLGPGHHNSVVSL